MKLYETIRLALATISLHKVRSFLTTLGMIFGVTSVISMMAIGSGAREEALTKFEKQGINNIFIKSKNPQIGESQNYIQYGITQQDKDHFVQHFDNVSDIF